MNRRNLIAALVGIGAAAPALLAGGFQRAAERIPLWSLVHREGKSPAAFAYYDTRAEAEKMIPDNDEDREHLEIAAAEFIPTGRYIAFRVTSRQVPEFTDPTAVPTHFGLYGWFGDCTSMHPGETVTRDVARAQVIAFNREAIGKPGQWWAVMVELGEPQGITTDCLECGPERFGMVSSTRYQPCRLVRA